MRFYALCVGMEGPRPVIRCKSVATPLRSVATMVGGMGFVHTLIKAPYKLCKQELLTSPSFLFFFFLFSQAVRGWRSILFNIHEQGARPYGFVESN